MKFYVRKINGRIIPENDSDKEEFDKIKANIVYCFEAKRPRNIKFHRKFFALLNLCFQNQEKYKNFEHLRAVLIMKAGYYDAFETDKGTIYLPRSISFASMDEDTFADLYENVFVEVCKMLGSNRNEIIKELLHF